MDVLAGQQNPADHALKRLILDGGTGQQLFRDSGNGGQVPGKPVDRDDRLFRSGGDRDRAGQSVKLEFQRFGGTGFRAGDRAVTAGQLPEAVVAAADRKDVPQLKIVVPGVAMPTVRARKCAATPFAAWANMSTTAA